MTPTASVQTLPRKELTDRQVLRLTHRVSVRTLSRYSHVCATHSLGWVRCNRWLGVDSAPVALHPYQIAILDWALSNRRRGSVWIKKELLENPSLTFAAWQEQQNTKQTA